MAVRVSAVPDTDAPNAIGALVPVSINANVPLAVIVFVVVIPPFALSVKLKFAPVDTPLPVIACESVNVTLPVVLAVTFGVTKAIVPIAPDPLISNTDVEPVTVPADCVIAPEPVAVIVSTVPDTDAPNAIGALVPVLINPKFQLR